MDKQEPGKGPEAPNQGEVIYQDMVEEKSRLWREDLETQIRELQAKLELPPVEKLRREIEQEAQKSSVEPEEIIKQHLVKSIQRKGVGPGTLDLLELTGLTNQQKSYILSKMYRIGADSTYQEFGGNSPHLSEPLKESIRTNTKMANSLQPAEEIEPSPGYEEIFQLLARWESHINRQISDRENYGDDDIIRTGESRPIDSPKPVAPTENKYPSGIL